MRAQMAGTSSSNLVDLRSDTVTRPTPAMRRAMAEAEVGDDGYHEDPTVNELEEAYAARVGKEAALYVPSGTMANQIAVRVQTSPGAIVVAGRSQHVVAFEAGAAARNASVQLSIVDDEAGALGAADVADAIELGRFRRPAVSLVCTENTHMASGGMPWTIDALRAVADSAGPVPVHMDGARLFNAEVATGVGAAEMAAYATTVMSCLSKGLCAPVGSVLAGPADMIGEGRVERKRLGGAMRQAGVIAAAGLVALRTMVDRLVEDHRRARRLAEAVAERWPDAGCDPDRVQTNLVVFRSSGSQALVDHLASHGVLAGMLSPGVVRLMTHHDVDDEGIERALLAISKAP
jgi:threonine aldolase